MKPSPRPRKTASLSASVQQQLNMYALAASAAGVGVLALVQPAEARIVYTPANRPIAYGLTKLDLDKNDGLKDADFEFCLSRFLTSSNTSRHTYSCPSALRRRTRKSPRPPEAVGSALSIYPHGGKKNMKNRIWGSVKGAYALPKGVSIGPKLNFTPGGKDMATWISSHGSSGFFGPWAGAKDRYLAFKFVMKGTIHYGWARLTVVFDQQIRAKLTGYAYETIPNKPIITGKTKGPDVTVEPATLGRLALGRR
jgi:hypothetical protein